MSETARVAALAEEAERTRDGDDMLLDSAPSGQPNRALATMMSVRLPNDAADAVTDIAAELGLPVSALLRGWILAGLAESAGSADQVIDRVSADLERLRGMVRAPG
jgi:hypothetical protein